MKRELENWNTSNCFSVILLKRQHIAVRGYFVVSLYLKLERVKLPSSPVSVRFTVTCETKPFFLYIVIIPSVTKHTMWTFIYSFIHMYILALFPSPLPWKFVPLSLFLFQSSSSSATTQPLHLPPCDVIILLLPVNSPESSLHAADFLRPFASVTIYRLPFIHSFCPCVFISIRII